jgi:hypothetical protein
MNIFIEIFLNKVDAISPHFLNLEYTIRKLLENQVRLKFNGNRQLLVCAYNLIYCGLT